MVENEIAVVVMDEEVVEMNIACILQVQSFLHRSFQKNLLQAFQVVRACRTVDELGLDDVVLVT